MPVAVPTPDQLKQIASQMGLSLAESDVASFIELMRPNVDAYNVIDQLPDDQYIDAADIVHIIEVAVSSWNRDTGPKLTGYARNGIPEYWVIDPKPGGAFHRFTEPHLGGYREVVTTELPDGITSLPF